MDKIIFVNISPGALQHTIEIMLESGAVVIDKVKLDNLVDKVIAHADTYGIKIILIRGAFSISQFYIEEIKNIRPDLSVYGSEEKYIKKDKKGE